jgi:hypothetical protein
MPKDDASKQIYTVVTDFTAQFCNTKIGLFWYILQHCLMHKLPNAAEKPTS